MTETKSSKEKRQRAKLFAEQKGLCCYCKNPMILVYSPNPKEKYPDNLCTLEHLYDRFHPERGQHVGEKNRAVACKGCNNKVAKERQREIGIEELHLRASHAYENV